MYYVYILTNWSNKVLSIGVTNNLERRLFEHKNKLVKGFTEKYNVNKLVYYESTSYVLEAIDREKQLKGWLRQKKIDLISASNPEWVDLSEEWYEEDSSLLSECQLVGGTFLLKRPSIMQSFCIILAT